MAWRPYRRRQAIVNTAWCEDSRTVFVARAIRRGYPSHMDTLRPLITAAALLAACTPSLDGRPDGPGGGIGAFDSSGGAADSSGGSEAGDTTGGQETSTGAGDSSSSGGDPFIFDVPPMPDIPPTVVEGCTAVDFLFVVDNSGSMADEQDELTASFPGFIAGVQSTLTEVDSIHVGVTTTDEYGAYPGGHSCRALPGLVSQTRPTGVSIPGPVVYCPAFVDGGNYMTQDDDLPLTFACAATVGANGSASERQISAMLGAIDPNHAIAGPGECNEGFIRPDALLVVVVITDEPDNYSPVTALEAYDAMVATKGGDETAIVMVSVIKSAIDTCDGETTAAKLAAITDGFTHGMKADICAPDFSPLFQDAADIVIEACEDFTPPPAG